MINLHIEISGADDLLAELSGLRQQTPYATSVAINNTLNDIQRAERAHVHQTFTVRRQDFIDRSIYIGPQDRAKKDRLEGTVRINPERDVLAKFDDGGEKRAQRAKSLAIPIVRIGAPSIIIRHSDALSVKNLLAAIDQAKAKDRRMGRSKGNRARLRNLAGLDIHGKRVFLVHARNGSALLVERTGAGSHGSLAGSRVLWAFRPSVPIKAELEFEEIGMRTALERWEANAEAAIELAIATAR